MARGEGAARYGGQSKFGWGFFGTELKRRREAAGMTQQELGRRVFCSGAYIGQFETGIRKPQPDIAARIDAELGTDGLFRRMCEELISSSPYANFFAEAAYLEGLATSILHYEAMFVPGLMQTAAYARAVFLGSFPLVPEEKIESWVAARMSRQRIVEHPTSPLLWVVLDESVIRRMIGGAAVMHEQLGHAAALARRRRAIVQVLPYAAGASALSSMLTLMTFEDAPPVAYNEGPTNGCLLDDPAAVARCELLYDQVRAAALSPEASLSLIESVMEELADAQ
ncbi:helix-turn-helix domain-containing protein [Streptomyces rectiverticillatus]|uniref:helix-turn-helix domain-containing protein n=1 Tax=Streptomyces rectiverticillatus TaxID=173860 RepID=UPI0015C32E77|nr:helix-turn-helix domain-containing protein [Streptomyces rectiverticillatus]